MPVINTQNQQPNQSQAQAQFLGRKLGFLIASSTMEIDIKEAWFTILPELSLEQVTRLVDILEAKYLTQKTKMDDNGLKNNLKKIKEKYQAEQEKLDKEILDKVKEIKNKMESIKSPQKP